MNVDLSTFGSASRCLLRLRENAGEAVISDQDFIARHRARYPDWAERPGELDPKGLVEMAAELNLARSIERTRDYDRLLAAHAQGRPILVQTEHAPHQTGVGRRPHRTTSLLETMDAQGFSLWWPDPNGQEETLPRAGRAWWNRWQALGLILHPSPSPADPAGNGQPSTKSTLRQLA